MKNNIYYTSYDYSENLFYNYDKLNNLISIEKLVSNEKKEVLVEKLYWLDYVVSRIWIVFIIIYSAFLAYKDESIFLFFFYLIAGFFLTIVPFIFIYLPLSTLLNLKKVTKYIQHFSFVDKSSTNVTTLDEKQKKSNTRSFLMSNENLYKIWVKILILGIGMFFLFILFLWSGGIYEYNLGKYSTARVNKITGEITVMKSKNNKYIWADDY